MTAQRPRGAIAVLQEARGNYTCTVRCDYIEDRKKTAQRRAMIRQRAAFVFSLLIVAVLLAALMPWRGTTPEYSTILTERQEEADTAAAQTANEEVTPDKHSYVPDAAEVEALAKLIYGEAGNVPSTTEQAAVVWCVLNRVDDPRFPDTVLEVIEAPYQFSGYDPEYPTYDKYAQLAADVLTRYHAERDGEESVGRILPAEYCFFTGDGKHNHFTIGWKDTDTWGWTLESPYED